MKSQALSPKDHASLIRCHVESVELLDIRDSELPRKIHIHIFSNSSP